MRPELFRAACGMLWGQVGDPWGMAGLMAFLPCNERNAGAFISGSKDVGEEFEDRVMEELKRGLLGSRPSPALEIIRWVLAEA